MLAVQTTENLMKSLFLRKLQGKIAFGGLCFPCLRPPRVRNVEILG
jgi:hypothetical protein